MCVYACVGLCAYACVHMCISIVCLCVYVCVCMRAYASAYVYAYVCVHVCACMHTYMHATILLSCSNVSLSMEIPHLLQEESVPFYCIFLIGQLTLLELSVLVFLHINCGSPKLSDCVFLFLRGAPTLAQGLVQICLNQYMNVKAHPSIHPSNQSAIKGW